MSRSPFNPRSGEEGELDDMNETGDFPALSARSDTEVDSGVCCTAGTNALCIPHATCQVFETMKAENKEEYRPKAWEVCSTPLLSEGVKGHSQPPFELVSGRSIPLQFPYLSDRPLPPRAAPMAGSMYLKRSPAGRAEPHCARVGGSSSQTDYSKKTRMTFLTQSTLLLQLTFTFLSTRDIYWRLLGILP